MQKSLCNAILMLIVIFNALFIPVSSITISMCSNNAKAEAYLIQRYDIDKSTDLKVQTVLKEGTITQTQWASGLGNNRISQSLSNGYQNAYSEVSSESRFGLNSNTWATEATLSLSTNLRAAGETKSQLYGSIGSSSALQEAWTPGGILNSNQAIFLQGDRVRADQSTGIIGTLGYSLGRCRLGDKEAEITGGLNGQGTVFSQMTASASDEASASGAVRSISQESKSYSTSRATSAQEESYSYLSSSDELQSTLMANACEHAGVQQDITALNGIMAYASARDATDLLAIAKEASFASGSIVASTDGLPFIGEDLTGDTENILLESTPLSGADLFALPLPSSTRPSSIIDNDNIEHIFVRGGDGSLWDNKGGDWYSLGGYFNLNPSAVKDGNGNIHIFVQGGDLGLWGRQLTSSMGGDWTGLGGLITSSPSAVIEPSDPTGIAIAARGTDNSLWMRNLHADTMAAGDWSSMGGYIKGDPFLIASNDGSSYVYTLARGGDDGLWVNKAQSGSTPISSVAWYGFGGSLTSDLSGAIEPVTNGFLKVAGRSSDNALWMCDIDLVASPSGKLESAWSSLGGIITSNPYVVFDTNGNIHTFARGGDNGLWDNEGIWANGVYTHDWHSLGGVITSDPKPLMNPNTAKIDIAVQGADGALWVNRMGSNNPADFDWYGLGGVIT
ncbi:MAG: hypothetical protein A4E49_01693 [Methanosaeta sp. PtaU1.Bin112]|nr:MAG: hypothetical protein A4E49_01693 [Methanosaeta sp. PtaU1.Bin112]